MSVNINSEGVSLKTDRPSGSVGYQEALDLAEVGNYDGALDGIRKYLVSSPDDVEALNDSGAILHCMGRSQEAIEHFVKARKFQPGAPEIAWNLAEAYLAVGQPGDAVAMFEEMDQASTLSADLLNRAADALLSSEDLQGALDMLNWSLKLVPDQEILHPMIEIIQHKMKESKSE
jgi:Flp pilus assembly protein TadD